MSWTTVARRYPDKKTYGPYPAVYVAMACKTKGFDFPLRHRVAELRFFGGDERRPCWCDPNNQAPIENDSWHVVAWHPLPPNYK